MDNTYNDIDNYHRIMTRQDSNQSLDSLFDSGARNLAATATSTVTPILSRTSFSTSPIEASTLDLALLSKKLTKLAVVLVGLPASGKSTVARQMSGYLNNNQVMSKIYNAGDIRRQIKQEFNDADFFDPTNTRAKREREEFATIAVTRLIDDLNSSTVNVGFLDATNTTRERRERMCSMLTLSGITNIIILDVQCQLQALLNFNILGKAHNNDYQDKDYTTAINDFKRRTSHYFKVYEAVTQDELMSYAPEMRAYIKCVNAGEEWDMQLMSSKFGLQEVYKLIKQFVDGYFQREGQRYLEAATAFYKV